MIFSAQAVQAIALPGVLATFAAGILSFLSPCVLPLVPVYLSFISGESVSTLKQGKARRFPLLLRSLAFVAGFTAIFVALAILTGGGMSFAGNRLRAVLPRIAGILIIVIALNVIFDFIPIFRNTVKIGQKDSAGRVPDKARKAGAAREVGAIGRTILLGMTFAAGWTPCVGPILSSILLFAGQDGNVLHSAALLAVYSAGLGIPFILAAIFLDRMTPLLNWFKVHATGVKIVSGLLLGAFGIAMLTGGLSGMTRVLSSLIPFTAP